MKQEKVLQQEFKVSSVRVIDPDTEFHWFSSKAFQLDFTFIRLSF